MGWNLRTKSCCVGPVKRNVSRDSLQGFDNRYIMLLIVRVTWTLVA